MDIQHAHNLDTALKALADGNRRAILASIRDEARPVGVIAQKVGLSQQTTSHHLRVLRKANLTTITKKGTQHIFSLDTDGLAIVRSYLNDFWPTRLSALKAAIESGSENSHG